MAAVAAPVRSTRDVVLDTAERHFAERGFAGASMREIAADAGLKNQASLYHHFRNKQALYDTVLSRGLEPILAIIAESARAGAPGDAFIDRVVDVLADHPYLPRLLQRAGLDGGRTLRKSVIRHLYPLYDQGVRALAPIGESWPADALPHLAAGLYNLIFGCFANATLFEAVLGDDWTSAMAIARQRRFLRSAVARLLDRPAPAPRNVRKLRRHRPWTSRSSAR